MSGPRYPNQQLRAVALETYFRGRFSMLNALEKVQAEFGDRFPNLFVPHAQHGASPALQPFQLRSAQLDETLGVAVNQASYVSFDYPGSDRFLASAAALLPRVLELGGVQKLERVVYRYENEIGLSRDADRVIPLQQLVNIAPPPGCGSADEGVIGMEMAWTTRWSHGLLNVQAAVDEAPGPAGAVLRLTIAATVSPAGPPEQLATYASQAHGRALAAFEALITPTFREFLVGSDEAAADPEAEEEGNS